MTTSSYQQHSVLTTARTALWHLRTGGPAQLRKWWRRRRMLTQPAAHTSEGALIDRYPAAPLRPRPPVFEDVRVGTILDEFSELAFASEWKLIPLKRHGWESQLDDLDFVFVESAWNGNGGQWKYQLTGTSGVKDDFINLIEACRQRGIPTVFWNKEDPPHYADFLEAARLFDVVFTSDVQLLERYRADLGHDRVESLSFAAQPAIHNPERLRAGHQSRDVAFGGMYFAHRYPERRKQMDCLLGAASDVSPKMEHGLEIFSRQHGGEDRYQFPDPLDEHVVGSLPYPHMLTAYKAFKTFLNVNSVVDSPSMCARRIFEISACGTPVVSAPSAGTQAFFPADEVFQPRSREEAGHVMRALVRSSELRDRTVHLAQRRIWQQHTYTHRAMTIMDSVGFQYSDPIARSASLLVSTNRPAQLDHVLETAARQNYAQLELVLLAHGFDLQESDVRGKAKRLGIENLTLLKATAAETLGECLNRTISASSGDVLLKMDDDDIYGEHYVSDQLAALRYSAADMVGKQAHYLYLTGSKLVMRRFPEREHKFTDLVMGPTMTAPRRVFEELQFANLPRGEDTNLQQRLVADGGTIYSADRFNFVQVRTDHAHTWQVDDALLLANSEVHAFDYAPGHYLF
ncbi:glycosyltransferase [Brevibacterium luteolum]|uniref:glycosyltransferase family protein n=1 Tax=Brevibacterium luteolum TaxID=199591 RepID=UPI0038795DB8